MTVQTQTQTLTYRCPHCGTALEVDPCAEGSLLICPSPACGKPFRVAVPVAEPIDKPTNLALPPGVDPPEPVLKARPAPPCPPDANGSATTPGAPASEVVAAPAVASPAAPAPAVVPATLPPVPEGAPHIVKLAMFRRYPFRCLGYFVLVAASVTAVVYGLQREWHWLAIPGAIVFALSAGRFFLWWLRMVRTSLVLTNRRLVLMTGVFTRDSIEFELARINDFNVYQTLLMRWLNVGDLAIISTDRRVVVMAVPDPQSVIAFLQSNIAARKKEEEQPDLVVVQQPAATQGAPVRSA
jgi:hypothetical protein